MLKKSKSYLYFIALSAAIGGFLFGYDTAVISGTISFVKHQFLLDTSAEGWYVSSALVGCILGVIMAGELSDRFSRKYTLILSGFLFLISALGCALCGSFSELIMYRMIGGVGVGIASMVSPMYISEVSPSDTRGRMVALYQFAITVGILVSYFANAHLLHLSKTNDNLTGITQKVFEQELWRGMLGSEAIPALVFVMILLFVSFSPRWLVSRGREKEALKVLTKLEGSADAKKELQEIAHSVKNEPGSSWSEINQKGIRKAIWIGVGLALLSQFTGINAIVYYGPRIMEQAGLQIGDALGGQVIIGIVFVLTTIAAIVTIDKLGRKKLMYGGTAVMCLSLIAVGTLFVFGQTNGILLMIFILIYIAAFSIGYGPVIWVLLAEIYPNKIRGRAMSIATFAVWIGTAIIGQIVPWMLDTITPAGTFFTFAVFCIPVFFILKHTPETKGKSLEEIEALWLQTDK